MKIAAIILIVLVILMLIRNGSLKLKERSSMGNDYKELRKSSTNRVFCGVCGGVGEYFNVDPTLIRLIAVLVGCTGAGILAYIIMAIIMPE